jgi:FkbM family methyltransferase
MKIRLGFGNPGYAFGTSEPAVQAFLAEWLRPGDVFYDVGANVGFFTLLAARLVEPEGRVYAFEPVPANVSALKENVSLNALSNVQIVEAAVAEETGTALLAVQGSLTSRLASDSEPLAADAIRVAVVSLDDAVQRRGFRSPRVVKIDAEGSELAVLRGMEWILREHLPAVVCELHQEISRIDALRQVAAAVSEATGTRFSIERSNGSSILVGSPLPYRVCLLEPDLDTDRRWVPHVVALPPTPPPRGAVQRRS